MRKEKNKSSLAMRMLVACALVFSAILVGLRGDSDEYEDSDFKR